MWNSTLPARAKYVVPMVDYHDAYAMCASKLTRWNVVDVGPKKDIMRMLADAVRAQGTKVGVSSHLAITRPCPTIIRPSWNSLT